MNFKEAIQQTPASIKSIAKMMILSRHAHITHASDPSRPCIVMGNGPSLNQTIAEHGDILRTHPSVAVNFAGIAPEFAMLRPSVYVLADPYFFPKQNTDLPERLLTLRESFASVTWPMTLYVPCRHRRDAERLYAPKGGPVKIATFNLVAVEGWQWLQHMAFRLGLGMPRPRNVLIPSIMVAIAMGYKQIYIVGADHSWMKTLSVDDDNRVVSIQPHFYKDDEQEHQRVRREYHTLPLHQVVHSMYVAFKAYHSIERYARSLGVKIYNATPDSMIDAFARRPLSSIAR